MGTLISCATGNFTTAGTWREASIVATSELDSAASTFNISTGNSDSSTFVLGSTPQVDAVLVKISAITTPTGTVTVKLRNSTTSTDVGTVTINASDLHASAQGWHVFSFSAHIANGTDSYIVRLTRSVADGSSDRITMFASTASASNMVRAIRTSTTRAPAVNDKLIIAGEFTGTGASTSHTVTMNNTATTSFGPTVSGGPPQGITINDKSTLIFQTTAATSYYLKWKGLLKVYAGGTFNVGTSSTPVPSNSSATLEMASVAAVDTGIHSARGSITTFYGAPRSPAVAITGASNTTPIAITSTSHGLVARERITIEGVVGNTAANDTWEVIASTGANTFTIGAINGGALGAVGTTTGNGTYSSGGTWRRLPYTRLTADLAAAGTVCTVLSTSCFRAGDEVCFTSTTRTRTHCEKKTIATIDSATQFTLSAGATSAHSGTYPTQCEVGLLTRNIKVKGTSASLTGYVYVQDDAHFTSRDAEFFQLGSVTTDKRGMEINISEGTFDFQYSSVHDNTATNARGIFINSTTISSTTNISRNVVYATYSEGIVFSGAMVSTGLLDGNLVVLSTGGSGELFRLLDVGWTITNNTVAGSTGSGFSFEESDAPGTFRGNTSHSNTAYGIRFPSVNVHGGSLSDVLIWRNASSGMSIDPGVVVNDMVFDNFMVFGNQNSNIVIQDGANLLFKNITCVSDTTFSSSYGVSFGSTDMSGYDIVFEDCSFGEASGIFVENGLDVNIATELLAQITFRNCMMASTGSAFPFIVNSPEDMLPSSYIASQRHNRTAGLHISVKREGSSYIDTAIYDMSPSERLIPYWDEHPLESSSGIKVFVPSGQTATVSVKVRQSRVDEGDASDYIGNLPTLVCKKNVAAGVTADTVLDTATAASEGAFETLSGTTPAITDNAVFTCVVRIDGTDGFVNVDSWSTS